MNKIVKQIGLLSALVWLMSSCNKDPEYFTLVAPADQMNITASAEKIILEKADETKDSVTFTWNKATDRGPDTELVYYFRLYVAEMKERQIEFIRLDSETYSMSWTAEELNDLLLDWNVFPGDEITVAAEVLAVVEVSPKYMKPEISVTTFNVVGY